ncbi:MAG: DNA methyltransferase [Pseudomonadota bacterium]
MPLSQKEIRDRALEFAFRWGSAVREKSEAQTFWNEFFDIFGISRRRVAAFEAPVKKLGDKAGSIDLFWKGMLIVEHKSRGQNLDRAYQQALDYFPGISEQELPKYVLVSDFANFRLYDLEADTETNFLLTDLPAQIHRFGFMSGYMKRTYQDEDPVNVKVAEKMGDLHDALLAGGYDGHKLEVFLVRLIYCLFADDTGIFPRDHFRFLMEEKTREDGTDTGTLIAQIFQTLDTPPEKREKALDEDLEKFPYVNGALYDEVLRFPNFNSRMRRTLLECLAFDWSRVSPAIFGSMFQSVMDPGKRRNLGAHYTSERNILKVVQGLFLDDLYREYEAVKDNLRKLNRFHERIARLRFFDPACGCGNFLIIAYRELRRLEIAILKQMRKLRGQYVETLQTDISLLSLIDVDAFYGIELEEFPVRIAEVALWLTDHQMNMELSAEFGQTYTRLPLKKSAHIVQGNALRMDWEALVSQPDATEKETTLFILGNPPFVGKYNRSAEQTADMLALGADLTGLGVLDYVCGWYMKATEYIRGTKIQAAFVSTNSITQGEQAGILWPWLLEHGVRINFAHRTFKWSNEARGNAHVYCVIIGFAVFDAPKKSLYDYETPTGKPMEILARNINPYLVDAADIVISNRSRPICSVPEIYFGSMPNDGGNLLFTNEEKEEFLAAEPDAAKFIKPLLSAHEFINGKKRWCLWLKDASPAEMRRLPEIMKRVESVRIYRYESSRAATRKLSDYPALFGEVRQPKSNYVLIPRHSSEKRRYVPMSYFNPNHIASDSCNALPNATLHHFGVLTSAMHMAWMRQVCGRLKSDYRYSNNLVYNNFPWPEAQSQIQIEKVEKAAQNVLDVRAEFADSSLADLYDPDAMPKKLLDAHRALDAAVDLCYRPAAFKTELERLQFLFDLYRKYTEPLIRAAARSTKRRSKVHQA